MTDGLNQITIPDFDDDDFGTQAIPFGRSANAFGFNSSSGSESPTLLTPTANNDRGLAGGDRDYFHSRQDSAASEDSTFSFPTPSSSTPARSVVPANSYANSSQTSLTTTTPFTKKSSFASLRNAFKSSVKASDPQAPPVPVLDRQALPALKNPFGRSASSLAYHSPSPSVRRPSVNASPPHALPRPPTPGSTSAEHRHARGTSKSRGHSAMRSQHSHTGSLFHNSDGGSDYSFGLSHSVPRQSTPPPVPRVPEGLGGSVARIDTPSSSDAEERMVLDPRTPSEFALHAVFIRFAASVEDKIEKFLKEPLEREPSLNEFMGQGVDSTLDDLLQSLGRIAIKTTKPVIDSIMRWRKSQVENVSGDIIRYHSSSSTPYSRLIRPQEMISILNERKNLAGIYIMCRALIVVVQSIPRDALSESMGHKLEDMTFDQFKRPDIKLLSSSSNHRVNADLYALLLGALSNTRFQSVTDRFLAELGPVLSNQVPKDLDIKYEYLVKALHHVQIKVWPPEAFEDGAEFMESLSKIFENAHGLRLKTTFAETLLQILHPIGKTAQAEVNHPLWAKAVEVIYPRARDMMNKPRYWSVAYPLAVTCLCVAPQEYFLRNWISCFEFGMSKIKEKIYRIAIMNGMMRLIWTYLYRCREPNSTSISRLEGLLKNFFPATRQSTIPHDDQLEPLIYILHFILSRHFEFGRDLALSLMQEQVIRNAQPGNISHLLAPEKTTIALEAILRSLYLVEKEESVPSWPSNTDFQTLPEKDDYKSISTFCPPSILAKPGMEEFFDRCGSTIASIASTCAKTVGRMSIFDDQWSYSRFNNGYEETVNIIIRQHPEVIVAYPQGLAGQINLLQTCISSWPRCLHPSLPMEDAIDMLIRGLIHVEPSVGEAASGALQRIIDDSANLPRVLSRFAGFLFSPKRFTADATGTRLPFESLRLLNVWFGIVQAWATSTLKREADFDDSSTAKANAQLFEVSAAALFLLSSKSRSTRSIGVKIVRLLSSIMSHFRSQPSSPLDELSDSCLRMLDALLDKERPRTYLEGLDDLLDVKQQARLVQWKYEEGDVILRLAESDDDRDRNLWWFVYPAAIRLRMDHHTKVMSAVREMWIAATTRYHTSIINISGINNRTQPPQTGRAPAALARERDKLITDHLASIEQWHLWVKLICCTAQPPEVKAPTHTRVPSDASPDRDLVATNTRGLFRYLMPFLDAESNTFRDIAVMCISSFPATAYKDLLDDLGAFSTRHFYIDPSRVKMSPTSMSRRTRRQDRLYLAVAHIYQLTARYMKDQRGVDRQDTLTNVLKFVKNTQVFLSSPEIRGDWQMQCMRRYFCGIVEQLFDGLSNLQSSDRFVPAHTHLTLYRLCEEWCQCGSQSERVKQRLVAMQTAATAGFPDPQQKAEAIERFQTETRSLSHAASGAMAALCQKAFFPPDLASNSPTQGLSSDFLAPLEISPTLDRLVAMLASMHDTVRACGRKALRSLVDHKASNESFLDEIMRRSFVTSRDPATSNCRFFEVVADAICNGEFCQLTFGHVVCLGIANLCSPIGKIRRLALDILDAVHVKAGGTVSLSTFEAFITSSAASTYLDAQRQISEVLCEEHSDAVMEVIAQCDSKLPQVQDLLPPHAFAHTLHGLAPWFSTLTLLVPDNSSLSKNGRIILYHLLSLTLHYADTNPEQVQGLWDMLVNNNLSNGHGTIRFLLEQSSKVGSSAFVSCARKVVACLSRTTFGRAAFEELCSVIEPARMLPMIEHKLNFPDAEEADFWSDLDALFAEQPKHSLGAGQFAMLFLADVALPRAWDFKKHLPQLLHGILTHIGHRNPFVREQARKLLFQTIRAWLPGYEELSDSISRAPLSVLQRAVADLERDGDAVFWTEDDSTEQINDKIGHLLSLVLQWLEPLLTNLVDEWGSLALVWGTSCAIRPIAFRSLQIFRALLPRVSQQDLAHLIGRLSNTIAAPETSLHPFTVEMIITLRSVAKSGNLDVSLLPQLYWCAVGSLSTPVEAEFIQVIDLLECILDRLNLDDPYVVELLSANKPVEFRDGASALQPLLLVGLRSGKTYSRVLKVLKRLSDMEDSKLIDPSGNRLRDLYTLILPWCLRAMEDNKVEGPIVEFAANISAFAEAEERPSIARIMTSFAKSRFRTRDDFMRQAAAALREHYASDSWTEVVTLLMSLVLNNERWLRIKSMQFLKVLFQLRETRNPVDRLGSELLMPLLRLLPTDLASHALEVLEEPMAISGGPAAKTVLRMSMHVPTAPTRDVGPDTEVFGIPEESGWSVARPGRQRDICRTNVMAVFDTCKMPTRPSKIVFQPEMDRFMDPLEEDLGDLVQNLHELSTFFLNDSEVEIEHQNSQVSLRAPPSPMPMPNQQLEARIAAILAKSTDMAAVLDSPQTPFADVFHVNPSSANALSNGFDESDDDSDSSDFDMDTFAFESVLSVPSEIDLHHHRPKNLFGQMGR